MTKRQIGIAVAVVALLAVAWYLFRTERPNKLRGILGGTAYTVTITSDPNTHDCVQTVSGRPVPYVTVSASAGDTIHYQGMASAFVPVVTFPLKNEITNTSPFPGTPFKDPSGTGNWGFAFQGSMNPGDKFTPVLTTAEQGGDIYFPYSSITINGTACNLPVDGMGIHVDK